MTKKNTKLVPPPLWSVLDLAEGTHLGHSLAAIERLGVLESLKQPLSLTQLAVEHRVDAKMLEAALRMLVTRTKLIEHRSGKYKLTELFNADQRYILRQYIGAYSSNAAELGRILRNPAVAGRVVDREQHARAFEMVGTPRQHMLADLMLQMGLASHVLDIGCGTGTMLLYLDAHYPKFRGWGLDLNPWMCAVARRRISEAGASRRIRILQGDSRDLENAILSSVAGKVRTLTASGVANEFFSNGNRSAADWLAGIKAMFPGRTMFIFDYYAQGRSRKQPMSRVVALHDFIQIISGQGVPPPSLSAWKEIYRKARCELIRVVEAPDSPTFIHVLKL